MADFIDNWWWQDYEELTSTNDEALKLSINPPSPFYVVTAKRQSSGRGRRGRSWIGLEGNLFMSLSLPLENKDIGALVFIVSLVLLETIKFFDEKALVQLKWPNDVLLNNRKISGILLEKGAREYIIAGIGVNIASAPQVSESVLYSTSCLAEAGIKISRTEFLFAYLKHFNRRIALWKSKGFCAIRDLWLEHAKGLNEEIKVNLPDTTKEGIFRGVDENGILLLEQDGTIEKIYAGDVFFRKE